MLCASLITVVAVKGMSRLETASTIIAEYWPASRALKYCLPQCHPPIARELPSTRRILLIIDPAIEALTTDIRPCWSAKIPIIISGALPKVALSNPPAMGPTKYSRSSVARPIRAASGIRLIAEQIKMAISCCRPHIKLMMGATMANISK